MDFGWSADPRHQPQASFQGLERFAQGVGDLHEHSRWTAPGLIAQAGCWRADQHRSYPAGLVKLAILTTKLHLASRIDVEEFAASPDISTAHLSANISSASC